MPDDDHSDAISPLLAAVRDELRRLGTPEAVLDRRALDATRRARSADATLPPRRRGQLLAQRETLFANIETVCAAVARALKHRRIAVDRRDDATHEVLLRVADRGALDGFEPDEVRADPDVTDAVAGHGLAIARYVAGFAWRASIDETRKESRRAKAVQRIDPALEPQERASPEVLRALSEVERRIREALSPLDFNLWVRCDVEGEAHDEVAASHAMNVKSMESRLYRARRRVAAILAEREVTAMVLLPLGAGGAHGLREAIEGHLRARATPTAEERDDLRRALDDALGRGIAPSRALRDLALYALGAVAGVAATLALSREPTPTRIEAVAALRPPTSTVEAPRPMRATTVAPVAEAPRQSAVAVAPASAAPVRTTVSPRATAPSGAGDLDAERVFIATARSAMGRNPPRAGEALASLDAHARRYPHGQLAETRDFLRVRALRALGRDDDAAAASARFRTQYPQSIHLGQLP